MERMRAVPERGERGMDVRVATRRIAGLGCCLLGAAALTGCAAGTSGFRADTDGTGTTLGNLLAFNKLHIGSTPKAETTEKQTIDCPPIEILDGTASARTYAGAEQTNSNVKYQFSMGDVVRECSRAGDQLILKVGVEGRVLIGPAGQAGSFTAPVRIAIRNDTDRRLGTSKFYNVPVSVPSGESGGGFSLVSDQISVPFIKAQANEDYTIVVGFDTRGEPAPAAKARKGRRNQT